MIPCFIGLGGNIENPLEALQSALISISQIAEIAELRSSRLYITSPISEIAQPDFLNAAAFFTTTLPVLELFKKLEEIEESVGKKKKAKQMPRTIDIDLIFYGNFNFKTPTLVVPHPRWQERLFVLKPLQDLVDILPNGQKVSELIAHFNDPSQKVTPLTHQLPFNRFLT